MNISELKRLVQKVGGLLVMDGDEPSFVVLAYGDYKQLSEGDGDVVAVHKEEQPNNQAVPYFQDQTIGLAEYQVPQEGLLINEIADYTESEEDKINRLNQEIALLKNEIKQREIELFVEGPE